MPAAGGGGANDEGEDIAAQLGLGSVANDLELDAAKEAAEAQIAAADGLIGRFAPLIACLCHHRCSASGAPLPDNANDINKLCSKASACMG